MPPSSPAGAPLGIRHSLTACCPDAVKNVDPSGLNATFTTVAPTGRVTTSRPAITSHTRTLRSVLPLATSRESGLNATVLTRSACGIVARSAPVSASQTRAVRSELAVASHLPSGLYAMSHSLSVWPSSVSSRARTGRAASSRSMRVAVSALPMRYAVASGASAPSLSPSRTRRRPCSKYESRSSPSASPLARFAARFARHSATKNTAAIATAPAAIARRIR